MTEAAELTPALLDAGIATVDVASTDSAIDFMLYYGYLPPPPENVEPGTAERLIDVVSAVKLFQENYGLQPTGELDSRTVTAMAWPRCGCKDIVPEMLTNPEQIRKEYVWWVESWVRTDFLSQTDQADLLTMAWNAWSEVCGVSARRTSERAEATTIISTGDGPSFNFDGPGKVLAWAYLDGSLLRFDLAETFVRDSSKNRGIEYLAVASHEIGHACGIVHATPGLMSPYYRPGLWQPQEPRDISRAVSLYGQPKPKPTPIPPTLPPTPPADGDPLAGRIIVDRASGRVYELRQLV